ncbi:MAG: hypothetical protein H0V73_05535, partial [Chloroflexi bacterium]|nr:hypothetical protein [Chloroflexota bacterium]
MTTLFGALRDRLLPAVLTAAGVTMIAAGLLSYTGQAVAAVDPSMPTEPPTIVSADPGSSIAFPTLPPIDASPSVTSMPSASA